MNPAEKAVREAAISLRDAIAKAEAVGFRVDFPRHAKDLAGIAISETGKMTIEAFFDSRTSGVVYPTIISDYTSRAPKKRAVKKS